jgi:hypothetical protein
MHAFIDTAIANSPDSGLGSIFQRLPYTLISFFSSLYAFTLGKLEPSVGNIPLILVSAAAFGGAFLFGIKSIFIARKERYRTFLLLLMLLLVISGILSLLNPKMGAAKALIYLSPIYYLLCVVGAIRLPQNRIRVVLLFALFALTITATIDYYVHDDEYGLKKAAQHLRNVRSADDIFVHSNLASLHPFAYYLSTYENQYILVGEEGRLGYVEEGKVYPSKAYDLEGLITKQVGKRVWVVYYDYFGHRLETMKQVRGWFGGSRPTSRPKVSSWLDTWLPSHGFTPTSEQHYPGVYDLDIFLYEQTSHQQ